ncbi:MAG: GIY-YIG nuclease family protein [Flavobacteriaceae bacterium]|nr:GIY-YIG nuclease family protein [Flavobacteriaceae bacterium]
MNLYFVYILECSDQSLYIGITNNLESRIAQHNNGEFKNSYTFNRRPLILRFSQGFYNVLEAIYFEKKIKGWSRAKKLALIKGDYDMLQILAECRNATHYMYHEN